MEPAVNRDFNGDSGHKKMDTRVLERGNQGEQTHSHVPNQKESIWGPGSHLMQNKGLDPRRRALALESSTAAVNRDFSGNSGHNEAFAGTLERRDQGEQAPSHVPA